MAVLVLNDSVGGLVEAATYCKDRDEKRPSLVGLPDFTTTVLCPEDLNESQPMAEDASPDTFYVRIMFDELLNPAVEDLIPILDDNDLETGSFTGTLANTQPVTLKCTGVDGALHDVPYDGYYSPSGNAVTWPVGPSLVIKQIGDVIVPTNSLCEVTLKESITDKQGNPVPADQRGPFKFKVSGIKPLLIDPADESEVTVDALWFGNFYLQFNTLVAAAPADTDFTITPEPGFCATTGRACITTAKHCDTTDATDVCEAGGLYSYAISDTEFGFGPIGYPESESMYSFSLKEGTELEDQCGAKTRFGAPSVEKNTMTTVTTEKFDLAATGTFSINDNDTVPANRKMKINFNAPIALAAGVPDIVAADTFTIEPAPMLDAATPLTPQEMVRTTFPGLRENDIFIRGHYQPNTSYKFTLKNGAMIKDNYGKAYVQMGDKVINFKTAPIAVTANTPANGAVVTKATPTSATTIAFTFNQSMDVATWGLDDIDLIGTTTTLTPGASATCATTTGTACSLTLSGVFAPGTYTIRLKAGATVKDVLGNDYVQAADRSIKFTVEEAKPSPPATPCLGA